MEVMLSKHLAYYEGKKVTAKAHPYNKNLLKLNIQDKKSNSV